MAADLVGFPRAFNDFEKGNGAEKPVLITEGPSLTRQEFMEECDINNIMQRYDAYVADPMRGIREPRYIDFTDLPDTLMGTMAMVHEATEAFMTLPAKVRREFDNDPVQFTEFACDPGNLEKMREWGLAAPPVAVEPPMRVEVVNPVEAPKEPQK